MKSKYFNLFIVLSIIEGLIALLLTMLNPSEPESNWLFGFSKPRVILIAVFAIVLILFFVFLIWFHHFKKKDMLLQKFDLFILTSDHFALIRTVLLIASITETIAFLFFLIFIPKALAPIAAWVSLTSWSLLYLLDSSYRNQIEKQSNINPFFSPLAEQQKKVLLLLVVFGVIYFLAFIPVNLTGAETAHAFYSSSSDEYVMYPIVTDMLRPKETLQSTLSNFFLYKDYVYGFPFYGFSAILLLPLKIFFGPAYADKLQLNLLILRQLVSVLPSILSALLVTYLATKFKKWWTALGLFAIILTLNGVIKYNTQFWHPDSLNLLFIMLTLFFLERDRLNFGKSFYLAAVFCGLSIATRVFGVFFFLAIAGILLAGVIKGR